MIIKNGNLSADVLETGIIKAIKRESIQYNLFQSNVLDNPLANIYIVSNGKYVGLLNKENLVRYEVYENGVKYFSNIDGNDMELTIALSEDDVAKYSVKANVKQKYVFTFDAGVGDEGFLDDKQSYASQYIDNKVFENANGYSIAMRRTLGQSTGFPQLEVKSSVKTTSYFTEGYDFFDLDYKFTQELNAKQQLRSRSKTYEMAYFGLETEEVEAGQEVDFYLVSKLNNEERITDSIIDFDVKEIKLNNLVSQGEDSGKVIKSVNGDKVSETTLKEVYGELKMAEHHEDELLAFFTTDDAHVVLAQKEKFVQRTHGHIITTGDNARINDTTLVSTNYMNGVFASQVAIGNVGQNFLNTNITSNLDLQKIYGQRIFVKINDEYQRLNVPSYYEIGFNYAKWVYEIGELNIEIISFTDAVASTLKLQIKTNKEADVIITDNLTTKFTRKINNDEISFKIESAFQKERVPNLEYKINTNGSKIDEKNETLNIVDENTISYEYTNTKEINFCLNATQTGKFVEGEENFEASKDKYLKFYDKINAGFKISANGNEDIEMYNTLIKWYTHNALIHFATPHGLEQHAGSAWGSRDVCQGPLEFFYSFKLFDEAREVLLTIFKNQNFHDGSWPQWFMFDHYASIRADDAHGDIIVWPIKALADYLMQTNDYSILDEEVPYYSWETYSFTKETYTVKEHVNKEIKYIEDNYLAGTHISSYGHGDWDDTLQPANSQLRKYMASGWTVPLTYQAFNTYADAIKDYDSNLSQEIKKEAELIASDFRKYMIKDGVVAGFIYKEDGQEVKYMLHPNDNETGIKYRLLPMDRSIISGLFTEDEVASHMAIIKDKLKCPDGVRLMDRPGPYNGGTMTYFQRAESASTVGREISLQYVHAHIRYIEALAKIDKGDEIEEALKIVTPFMIRKYVKNADFRQSNAYFSSSEGDYDNRYQYAEQFDLLKTGDIKVKGGWRIYSSGPGIYLNQFITNYLGVKVINNELVISPAISQKWKDTKISFVFDGKEIELEYKLESDILTLNGQEITERYTEDYKKAGFIIDLGKLEKQNKIILG